MLRSCSRGDDGSSGNQYPVQWQRCLQGYLDEQLCRFISQSNQQ